MITFKIAKSDWHMAKEKIRRKYNHLNDADLDFEEGQEEQLIQHLMSRLHRNREYILFTLSKSLNNIESNRL
ncbi:hypothetical protein LZQ00_14165 [Sphingobacterium sp. SRCM116780]|uniref:hypothetical protein n=1 Tax=Sphingobacterium sp. SRCM116780 TaxID=2907623 RepID=UPI001F3E8D50|nr:hypothetical protein [Sphingobacterium sp. SRCM116780]UIR55406.1 hypothetical protein LZQ00_14165 [Sphingobacterium sp. SRCM116780]